MSLHTDLPTRIAEQLNQDLQDLAPDVTRRLTGLRLQAVDSIAGPVPRNLSRWWTLSGIVTATAMLLAVLHWNLPAPIRGIGQPLEDLDLLSSPGQLELCQDLEFYRWLGGDRNGG